MYYTFGILFRFGNFEDSNIFGNSSIFKFGKNHSKLISIQRQILYIIGFQQKLPFKVYKKIFNLKN